MGRSIPWHKLRRLTKDVVDPNWHDTLETVHLSLLRQDCEQALAQTGLAAKDLLILRHRIGLGGCEVLSDEQLARILRLRRERVRAVYLATLRRVGIRFQKAARRWYEFD